MQEAFGSLTREYKRSRALLDELDDALDEVEKQRRPLFLLQGKKLNRQVRKARVLLQDLEELASAYPMTPELREILDDVDRQLDRCDRLEDVLAELVPTSGSTAPQTPAIDNLPALDLFVGREAEIARCLEGLSPQERGWGVVIDGQGGLGKSALALAVAIFVEKKAISEPISGSVPRRPISLPVACSRTFWHRPLSMQCSKNLRTCGGWKSAASEQPKKSANT
jgi:hypothetical protein